MGVVFYQGRFPSTMCEGADKTVFFRAGARVFAQRGPVNASLLAIDSAGSVVRDVLNESQFTYSPYGYAVGLENGHCRLGFNGELYDYSFQGYLLGGKRAFIPHRPGFNSPDELNMRGDELNVMSYCSGDPVNYSDPSGRTRTLMYQPGSLKTLAAKSVADSYRAVAQLRQFGNRNPVKKLDTVNGHLAESIAYWNKRYHLHATQAMEPGVLKHYFKGVPKGDELAKAISARSGSMFLGSLGTRERQFSSVKLDPVNPDMGGQKIIFLGMLPQDAKRLAHALKPYQSRLVDHLSGTRPDPALFNNLIDDPRFMKAFNNIWAQRRGYFEIMDEIRGG